LPINSSTFLKTNYTDGIVIHSKFRHVFESVLAVLDFAVVVKKKQAMADTGGNWKWDTNTMRFGMDVDPVEL